MSEFEDWTKTYKAKPIAPPSDHIVDANKKVEPIASVNSIRDSIGQGTINILIKDGLNPGDYLYTHPAPSSALVKAAEEAVSTLVLLTNAPYSSAESHEIIMSVVTDLRAVLDKNK